MVAAGIMCQIYSMKGLLRKLSSGGQGGQSKNKKNPKNISHPLFSPLYPFSEDGVWKHFKCLQPYLVSTIFPYVTPKHHLSNQKSSPTIHLQFSSAFCSSTVLKCANDMPVCNEGIFINPWRRDDQGSTWWPKLLNITNQPSQLLKSKNNN